MALQFAADIPGWGGGVFCSNANPTIQNCRFMENFALYGSGIYNSRSNPVISNCTFANSAREQYQNKLRWWDI